MTEDHDEIIRLGENVKTLKEGLDELRRDRKAGILAILGLVVKAAFDHFTKGN